ncbi:MAG: GGDEF domain-containing protein [Anaerotignum sp.]|nr:GGDEF domain-containing protein [Anaerotignum sp.]
MDRVRFTEYIPQILGLNETEADALSSDHHRFRAFIETIRRHPIPDEPNIFRIPGEIEKYVRLEEITEDDAFFGVCIDETEDILKRQKIEVERDYDLLTGLYNRRGLDRQLSILFQHPEKLGLGALIMIDADGLKQINDTYGHENGDLYLIKISEVIDKFGLRSNLSARQGGDEFVLLLYDYDSEDELQNTLRTLEYIQTHSTVRLSEDLNVPLRFSHGYALLDGTADTQRLFKEADERMYANKRERKQQNNA